MREADKLNNPQDDAFPDPHIYNFHLDSLKIDNFRCFDHLVVEQLGRVNLIVGKNSVGKTALLEGLWLLASEAEWPIVHKILYERNDLVRYNLPANSSKQEQIEAIRTFFTRSQGQVSLNNEFIISRQKGWTATQRDDLRALGVSSHNPYITFSLVTPGYELNDEASSVDDAVYIRDNPKPVTHLIQRWKVPPLTQRTWIDLPEKEQLEYDVITQSKKKNTVFIPLKGLTWQAVSTYWDDMALTDKEEAIISCLKVIDPSITRFTFKGDNMKDRVRYSVVKTGRLSNPVPLANLGEGIQRVFSMALAMSTASNGYLLIDEFETGLHHSIQADVWRAVFKLAHEWNVQVFATTHSWDCVEAFHEAAAEIEDEEAMLIRLQRKRDGSGIVAATYDKKSMDTVTRQGIEVR